MSSAFASCMKTLSATPSSCFHRWFLKQRQVCDPLCVRTPDEKFDRPLLPMRLPLSLLEPVQKTGKRTLCAKTVCDTGQQTRLAEPSHVAGKKVIRTCSLQYHGGRPRGASWVPACSPKQCALSGQCVQDTNLPDGCLEGSPSMGIWR